MLVINYNSFSSVAEALVNAKYPEDIFSIDNVHVVYKKMSRLVHPDAGNVPDGVLFAKLGNLYSEAKTKISNATFGVRLGQVAFGKTVVDLTTEAGNDSVCSVYRGTCGTQPVLVKVLNNKKNVSLLTNEVSFVQKLSGTLSKHFPKVGNSGSTAVTYTNMHNFYSLAELVKTYPSGVDLRTAAWIFNRMLAAASIANQHGVVNTTLLPETMYINTDTHNGILLSWYGATELGKPAKFMLSKRKEFYPSEVANKAKLTAATDIYMAAKCFLYVLGSTKLPKSVLNFVKYCTLESSYARPSGIDVVFDEFQEILKTLYGDPSFHHAFPMGDKNGR